MNRLFDKSLRIFVLLIIIVLMAVSSLHILYIKKFAEESKVWTTRSSILCKEPIKYLPNRIHNSGTVWSESEGAFFYSAYYDFRFNYVAVISIIPNDVTTFYCLLWFKTERSVWIVPVSPKIVPDTHKKKYYVSIYQCENPFNNSLPYAVTMTRKPCTTDFNATIKIVYNKITYPQERHWCLSPLFRLGSNDLSESLALHRTIGIDRATIFVMSDVLKRKFDKVPWVTAIKWSLPVRDIHYYAQCAAMNDCLYRNMFTSKYMVFTDLDEIFMPRRLINNVGNPLSRSLWKDLDVIQEKYNNTLATFYAQSALFPTPFYFKGAASLKITKRFVKRQDTRKKYIIVPDRIDFIGIHYTFPIKNYHYLYLQENVAVLHHYRRCRRPETECLGYTTAVHEMVEDKFILQLKNHLNNLINKYRNVLKL
ncbi:DgyrCDS14022 [Dimorphilus gyrociliatus]|uniref:Glycosyltransferase family 92 protein n=1 Tax=Dimorphilus gyrociliatus TaxID=2664684 RepID=A0A7I8WCK6_9ANNE|nr:DgyrCDS14022 [Dimorphilus gyrociliatus]